MFPLEVAFNPETSNLILNTMRRRAMLKVAFKYKNKRTGEIYDNLLEAREKLGVLGYIDLVESGELVKVVTSTADMIESKLSAKPKEADE